MVNAGFPSHPGFLSLNKFKVSLIFLLSLFGGRLEYPGLEIPWTERLSVCSWCSAALALHVGLCGGACLPSAQATWLLTALSWAVPLAEESYLVQEVHLLPDGIHTQWLTPKGSKGCVPCLIWDISERLSSFRVPGGIASGVHSNRCPLFPCPLCVPSWWLMLPVKLLHRSLSLPWYSGGATLPGSPRNTCVQVPSEGVTFLLSGVGPM